MNTQYEWFNEQEYREKTYQQQEFFENIQRKEKKKK